MMDNCCAPQWADFTCSPQIPSDSYFDMEHEVHDPQMHIKSIVKSNLLTPCKKEDPNDQLVIETKFDDSLEPEPPACTKIAYFIPHDNKKHIVENVKKENQLSKALKGLNLDEKSNKIHQTWNISVTELTSAFQVSRAEHKVKPIMPEKIKKSIRTSEAKEIAVDKFSLKNVQTNNIKKESNLKIAITKIKDEPVDTSNVDNCLENNLPEKRLSYKIISLPQRQSGSFKTKRYSLGKSQPKVLTCQYRRRSLMKYRRCSNQFISLAEAVSKFQNGTPQRFRTYSKKTLKPGPLMKLKRSPLKLTLPISPALRCKQRTRQTTILSKQEREKLEMEEMKKHQIKANPVPVNILKGPSVLKKVTKKPTTVTEEFHLTQPKKTRHTTGPAVNLQQNSNDREQKNPIPITRSTSASNVKKENACTESAAEIVKAMRFTFETRNKEFLMKKEEKLKTLHDQETQKIKAEFHARPVPKFLKPTNLVKEQKKRIVPCPFSFEARNKCLAKKKEDAVKQIQEQNKKTRVFHANPVPSFKPVMVHGLSKENLRNKEKVCGSKELVTRQTKSCNDQENKQPNIINNVIVCTDTKNKETKQHMLNYKPEKKHIESNTDVIETKNKKLNAAQKAITKFKLNTDKRAKERNEFDEKIRKKEQELEEKRLAEEKNKLLKEKLERAELRKMAEVKARPMPVYKPLILVKSSKPPTSPRSPALGNRTKAKSVS